MNNLPEQQKGASAIFTIIMLAVLGYVAYIGIQYVPQFVESKSIDSVLESVKSTHKTDPLGSEQAVEDRVIRALQINEIDDMADNFSVHRRDGGMTVTFSYDRELNLIYKKHLIHHEKSLSLR